MNHATYYRKALEKIAKRDLTGRFSARLEWADDAVDSMVKIAEDALAETWEPDDD